MNLKHNIYLKLGIIVLIVLLLLIPTSMIHSLITDRQDKQSEAIVEVSSKWGEAQTIRGPFLTIPYVKYTKVKSGRDTAIRINAETKWLIILPTQLKIDGKVIPQKLDRGIFDVVVYNSNIEISGSFSEFKFENAEVPLSQFQFDKAKLVVGISDLRGIEKQVELNWDNSRYFFNPGNESGKVVNPAINSSVLILPKDSQQHNFKFLVNLKGSQQMFFSPVGKITDVNIKSSWSDPKFTGAYLPDDRDNTGDSFSAHWNVLHLNRNFPQQWINDDQNVENSDFGFELLLTVDNYKKSFRSIQYAILFIAFTFIVFFFVEIMQKVFIHPIQYILVGFALIVFFTLLLSISEQLNFNLAYLVSALATLILVTGYVKAILKNTKIALMVAGILALLYSFIFVIIQLEDMALLIGSIGLFIVLSTVMYLSRKIDWYNLNQSTKPEGNIE